MTTFDRVFGVSKCWCVATVAAALVGSTLTVWADSSAKPTDVAAEERYDISKVAAHLQIVHDGKEHYIVHVPFSQCGEHREQEGRDDAIFYGDGKVFWRIPKVGGGATCGESFSSSLWDPRHKGDNGLYAEFSFKNNVYSVTCDARTTALQKLEDAQARSMISAAQFFQPRWQRQSYRLARDNRGNYYYVDKKKGEEKLDFQLWIGPRGNLKRQKMRNIVSDSAGDIFSTRKGELRLIVSQDKQGNLDGTWIRRRRKHTLTVLPQWENRHLIYRDLGVYVGVPLGTPCDDL